MFLVYISNLEGCGYILLKKEEDGMIRVIKSSSIAAKKTWTNILPLEMEAIGLVWSACHLNWYLEGVPSVEVIINHKSIQTLMMAHLESLSPCMHACTEQDACCWPTGSPLCGIPGINIWLLTPKAGFPSPRAGGACPTHWRQCTRSWRHNTEPATSQDWTTTSV